MARASPGIEVFDQIHRAFDVGEQRRDCLALAVKRRRREVSATTRTCSVRAVSTVFEGVSDGQPRPAFTLELCTRRISPQAAHHTDCRS